MRQEAGDFKTSYAALVEESRAASGPHVLPEEVAALEQGDLQEPERSRVRGHLLACRDCFEIWRDFKSFAAADAAPLAASVGDLEAARFLRRLRPRLDRAEGAPRRASAALAWRLPLAAAASLIAVVGLSIWVVALQRTVADRDRTIAELAVPRPNAPIYDLTIDTSLRSGGEPQVPEVPAGTGFTVVLTPQQLANPGVYQLKIFDPKGVARHTIRGLERNVEDDTFTVWIPPDFLGPGEYRLELSAGTDGSDSIATYRLRIVRPDD